MWFGARILTVVWFEVWLNSIAIGKLQLLMLSEPGVAGSNRACLFLLVTYSVISSCLREGLSCFMI